MMSADKRGEIDYDEVQDQMPAMYKRLKKAKKSKLEIFNEIALKIHKVSLQEDIYCQIVVSYFIQSCEVFDAITQKTVYCIIELPFFCPKSACKKHEQATSYEVQEEHNTTFIQQSIEWEFAGIFADGTDIIGLNQKTFITKGFTD